MVILGCEIAKFTLFLGRFRIKNKPARHENRAKRTFVAYFVAVRDTANRFHGHIVVYKGDNRPPRPEMQLFSVGDPHWLLNRLRLFVTNQDL